jgi:hypothetical protein
MEINFLEVCKFVDQEKIAGSSPEDFKLTTLLKIHF